MAILKNWEISKFPLWRFMAQKKIFASIRQTRFGNYRPAFEKSQIKNIRYQRRGPHIS
jgi:hypothetical protein